MIELAAGFLASFVFIFFKAFQQRNVAYAHYPWIVPTSIAMASMEFYIIAAVARNGYSLAVVLTFGSGAGLGAMLATYVHERYLTRYKKETYDGPKP